MNLEITRDRRTSQDSLAYHKVPHGTNCSVAKEIAMKDISRENPNYVQRESNILRVLDNTRQQIGFRF